MTMSKDMQVEHQYIDGYVPSSYDAPHSSLQRSLTWLGMGAILSCLPGLGIMVFGLATWLGNTQEAGMAFAIGGAVVGFGMLFLGFFLVHLGRRNYKEYKARSGRLF